jgi:hypothetical protein
MTPTLQLELMVIMGWIFGQTRNLSMGNYTQYSLDIEGYDVRLIYEELCEFNPEVPHYIEDDGTCVQEESGDFMDIIVKFSKRHPFKLFKVWMRDYAGGEESRAYIQGGKWYVATPIWPDYDPGKMR